MASPRDVIEGKNDFEGGNNSGDVFNTTLKVESELLTDGSPNNYSMDENIMSEHYESALSGYDNMCHIPEDNGSAPLDETKFIQDHGLMGHNDGIYLSHYVNAKNEIDSEQDATELQDHTIPENCESRMGNSEDGSHLKDSKDLRQSTCVHCSKRFHDKFNLLRHMRTHTGERPFKCEYCDKAFRQSHARTLHTRRIHTKEFLFNCRERGKGLVELYKFVSHRSKHSKTECFKCYLCKNSFNSVKALKNHINIHIDQCLYMCMYCQKPFIDDTDYKEHKKACESKLQKSEPEVDGSISDNSEYNCSVCGENFREKCMYIRHIKVHENEQEGSSNSDIVLNTTVKSDSEFLSDGVPNNYVIDENIMSEHHESAVSGYDAMCNIPEDNGSAQFEDTKLFISDHGSIEHNDDISLSHSVDIKLEVDSQLDTTELQDHTTPENCEERMGNSEDGSHLKNSKDIRQYTCVHCSRCFNWNSALRRHVRIHTDERPFKCQYCDKAFRQPHTRTNHVRRIHTKKFPFKCNECGKEFVEKYRLVAHSRKHSECFKCYLCKKSFNSFETLKKLVRIHNDQFLSMCTYCLKRITGDTECNTHKNQCESKPQQSEPEVDGSINDNSVCGESVMQKCMYKSCIIVHENEQESVSNSDVVLNTTVRSESEFLTDDVPNIYGIDRNVMSEHHESAINGHEGMCNIPEVSDSEHLEDTKLFISDYGSIGHNDDISLSHDVDIKTEVVDMKMEVDSQQDTSELHDHTTAENCEESMDNSEDGSHLKDLEDVSTIHQFACVHCSRRFRYKRNLERHMIIHTSEHPFKCQFCDEAFREAYDRTVHARRIHRKERTKPTDHSHKHSETKHFQCYLCEKTFNCVKNLCNHIKIHSDQYISMCTYCLKPFTDDTDCKVHKEKCESKPQKSKLKVDGSNNKNSEYNCSVCGKTFAEKCMYESHIKVHENEQESVSNSDVVLNTTVKSKSEFLTDDEPNKYVIDKNTISEHHESAINGREGMCNIPEDNGSENLDDTKLFISVHDSIEHNDDISLSHDVDIKMEVVDIKMEVDTQQDTTELHDQTTAENCNESMGNSEDGSHLKSSEDIRQSICVYCSKRFHSNSELQRHMRTHTGECPFKCEYCDKAFRQTHARTIHVRRIHTKEFPFKCNECDKGFVVKSRLASHSRIHSKTFKCYLCKILFHSVRTLKKHIKIHNDQYVSICTYCLKPFTDDNDCKAHKKECESKPQKS